MVGVLTALSCACPSLRGLRSQAPDVRSCPCLQLGRATTARKNRRCGPLRAKSNEDPFSMESLKKAMEGLKKEPSVPELLREQMQEAEFDDNGGDGKSGGGGDGSGGDGSSGQDDDMFDEILQMTLATLGIIFLYIYIIRGEELVLLVRDFIRYRLSGRTSMRLDNVLRSWRKLYKEVVWRGVVHEDWLERSIIATPTWWHDPQQHARLYRQNMKRREHL